MKLLEVFKRKAYANDVGPGVYDIHSPRVPSVEELKNKIKEFIQAGIRKDRMVVNPDCGLKTRGWSETEEALKNMVAAAKVSFFILISSTSATETDQILLCFRSGPVKLTLKLAQGLLPLCACSYLKWNRSTLSSHSRLSFFSCINSHSFFADQFVPDPKSNTLFTINTIRISTRISTVPFLLSLSFFVSQNQKEAVSGNQYCSKP